MRFILIILVALNSSVFAQTTSKSDKSDDKKVFETVTINTEDKFSLKADLYIPEMNIKDNKRLFSDGMARAFLLIHGEAGNRTQMSELAARIHRLGFVVLNLDLRGHGESKTDEYGYDILTEEQRSNLFIFAYRDLTAAIKFLTRYKDKTNNVSIHGSQISLLGYGIGATLLMDQYKRVDESIINIGAINPPITDEADYVLSTPDILGETVKANPDVVTLFGKKNEMEALLKAAKKSVGLEDESDILVKIKNTGDGSIEFYSSNASAKNFTPIVDWINDKFPTQKK